MRILLVEDERRLSEALAQLLRAQHHQVTAVPDGEAGCEKAMDGVFDVIILDIMLPKMDGLTVLARVRQAGIATPVLLLTAKDEVADKVKGLDAGADDYLTKPFSTEELLARLRVLTRRPGEVISDDILRFGDLALHLSSYVLSCGAAQVSLGHKEFEIARILLAHGRAVTPKEELIVKVWGYDADVGYNNVEVYLTFLRKKLAYLRSTVQIRPVRGVGYVLEDAA